jgi:hypothetical protein
MSPHHQKAFLDAVVSLSGPQMLTLYNFPTRLLDGTRYSHGMDILYEVIGRVLRGSRIWETTVPLGAFLHEAMRSVASVDRRHPGRRPLSYEDWMESGFDAQREAENEFACSPEDLLMNRQEKAARRAVLDAAEGRLTGHEDVLAVFSGLAAAMSPTEICEAHGMTKQTYKAARARIVKDIRSHCRGP